MSVNKAILIGHVGGDPEIHYLEKGVAVASFNLATTEQGYTTPGGAPVAERTEWHSIVLWRDLAEWSERYVRKGMKIYVEGRLQTRYWEKDGYRKQKTEIIAEKVEILWRPEDQPSKPERQEDPYLQIPTMPTPPKEW